MEPVLFEETQHFRQWWVWLVILLALIFPAIMVIIDLSSEDTRVPVIAVILALVIPVFLIALLYFMNLKTRITATGISYRFSPVHRKFRFIPFSDTDRIYVRSYSPLGEFGGWGIRYSFNGKAYNVSGNQGIQLELKNGKRILIGTQRPEEAEQVLNSIHNFSFSR